MWEKIKAFLCESNHPYHIAGGTLQILAMIFMGKIFGVDPYITLIMGTVMVFFTMFCVELKDKQGGGLFDWSDILAGELAPILCWVVAIIYELFAWIF